MNVSASLYSVLCLLLTLLFPYCCVSALLYLHRSFSFRVSGCMPSLSRPCQLRVCLALLRVMLFAYHVMLVVSLLSACLPCVGKGAEWDRVFLRARRGSHDGKTLCQSCWRGCDSTVEEKGIKEGRGS